VFGILKWSGARCSQREVVMSEAQADALNLKDTYVFLRDGGSAPLVPSGGFWQELMSGQPKSPGVALVAGGDGWLLAKYSIDRDAQAWELHPAGDELLTMLVGEMDVVFERAGAEVTVSLQPGQTCLVPRGMWHRQVVRRSGEYLGITYGKGTQHRPR
jgi:mannose-6-phosphate isomerase-like protein (cupin superfamily)